MSAGPPAPPPRLPSAAGTSNTHRDDCRPRGGRVSGAVCPAVRRVRGRFVRRFRWAPPPARAPGGGNSQRSGPPATRTRVATRSLGTGRPSGFPSTSQEPGFLHVAAEMPTFLLGALVLYFYHQKANIPVRLFPQLSPSASPLLPDPSRPPLSVSKQNGAQGQGGDPGTRERARGPPRPSTRCRRWGAVSLRKPVGPAGGSRARPL